MGRALVVVWVVAAGCSGARTDPPCKAAGEACDPAAECCAGLSCTGGQCSAPVQAVCGDGRCAGETQATCCLDCGCPSGQTCGGINGCAATPTCGDRQCAAPETQMSCCGDCGCPDGSDCAAEGCVVRSTCGDGICGSGENSSTCCNDCPCTAGSTCTGSGCADPATCGDQVCAATEAGRCCKDCGCTLGSLCSADGTCPSAGTSNLLWTLSNQCLNGERIQLRFFDRDDRLLWPDASNVYTLNQGVEFTYNLMCTTGAKICYGANQPTHHLYWGVDIDNSKACTGCCFDCASKSVRSGNLTCP